MNGTRTNGTANGNEHGATTRTGLDRIELVRILVQALDGLGYAAAARGLEREAGVVSMSGTMRALRECVLEGSWDELEEALAGVTAFKSAADASAARFVLYEQKFLELLEGGRTAEALRVLREDLTRLSPDPKLLHKLPLLCMCTTAEEVRAHAAWPGAGVGSRMAVLEKLQKFIPPYELLQEDRLEILLSRALDEQMKKTKFPYTNPAKVTLLEDFEHCPDRFPRNVLHTLQGHSDEVLFVQFSNNGHYLASASRDTTICIWDIRSLRSGMCSAADAVRYRLKGHQKMIYFLSWSPDDSKLLSCGLDTSIRLWDTSSGECLHVLRKHTDQVTACVWMPHGRTFVSGSHDKKIYEWDISGECLGSYPASFHVNDLTLTSDGKRLIATCADKTIQVFDTTTKDQIQMMSETVAITSIFLANDGQSLLVNTFASDSTEVEEPEIRIWNLADECVSQTFKGFPQTRFVIRSCFGGHNQMLVLCGSEDKHVYMWERRTGELIARLEGHTGTVNTIAFCPIDADMFASGSDDNSVLVSYERERGGGGACVCV